MRLTDHAIDQLVDRWTWFRRSTGISLSFLITTAREETMSPIGWCSTRSTEMPERSSWERHSLRSGSELPTLTPSAIAGLPRQLVYLATFAWMTFRYIRENLLHAALGRRNRRRVIDLFESIQQFCQIYRRLTGRPVFPEKKDRKRWARICAWEINRVFFSLS